MIPGNIVSPLADLAEAAYVNFVLAAGTFLEGANLATQLQSAGWPEARQAAFIIEWRVVTHQPNTASGFSATVFERRNPMSVMFKL